jgi:hypothetical protein
LDRPALLVLAVRRDALAADAMGASPCRTEPLVALRIVAVNGIAKLRDIVVIVAVLMTVDGCP